MHPEFQAQPKDELLELIWRRREDGDRSVSGLLADARRQSLEESGSAAVDADSPDGGAQAGDDDTTSVLRVLEREDLVRIRGDEVLLTESGESRARTVIRGHRLAKRLLFDVFALPPDEIERTACLMEHILGPATADAVCAFLGHPPRSPAGREIPPGECCAAAQERRVQPLVVPLHELPRGGMGRIAFMTPSYQKRFDRLGTFGVVPGNRIRLRQTQPSVVIEIDGTSLALDRDVAREIYVRRET